MQDERQATRNGLVNIQNRILQVFNNKCFNQTYLYKLFVQNLQFLQRVYLYNMVRFSRRLVRRGVVNRMNVKAEFFRPMSVGNSESAVTLVHVFDPQMGEGVKLECLLILVPLESPYIHIPYLSIPISPSVFSQID